MNGLTIAILIISALILIVLLIIGFFIYKSKKDEKEQKKALIEENKELKDMLNKLVEKSIESKTLSEKGLKDLYDSSNSLEKDVNHLGKKLDSIESNSNKSTKEIYSLFNNGKSVGQIGEDYLYSILLKLGCKDISSSLNLINDQDILTYLVSNNIKFAFSKQVLIDNGAIPDCVVFTAVKINQEEYILKKVIIDSKAIIQALDLNDGDDLSDKLISQMKGLAKKEYFKHLDNSFNNVILFFPFIGLLDLLKDNDYKVYKDMLNSFKEQGIVFSTSENILLTLEIILDGYNTHDLQVTSKSKQEIIEKSKDIELLQKKYKHGLKERINSSEAVSYLGGTIKRLISVYKYMLQFESDIENNIEIQSVLKEIDEFNKK